MAKWFLTEKAKNVASLISAFASVAAILVALLKPGPETKAADAYVVIHDEMMEQRSELQDVHKGLSDMGAWIAVLRDRENERRHMMLGFSIDESLTQKKVSDPNEQKPQQPAPLVEDDGSLPPVPAIPPPHPPRTPLPSKEKLFR
ncbi:MAG: hypothetical protein EBR82_30070 [Caulobacteraceae bacterium]|nr:hypothetical protein [Caulobacteraceae bacterium]